jgi:chemotaxis response regulator CheB
LHRSKQVEPKPIAVLVADADMRYRWVVSLVLADQDDMILVGEAGDGRQAVAQTLELEPDVASAEAKAPISTTW